MSRQVQYTVAAITDLEVISDDYLSHASSSVARKLVDKIDRTIAALAVKPARGSLPTELFTTCDKRVPHRRGDEPYLVPGRVYDEMCSPQAWG